MCNDISYSSFSEMEYLRIYSMYITEIEDDQFRRCNKLKEVLIEKAINLKRIGRRAFMGTPLERIYLYGEIETIGDEAFKDCTNLSKVYICDSVKSIGFRSFFNSNLSDIKLPSSLVSLMAESFGNNPNINNVSLPSKLKYFDPSSFDGCPIMDYYASGEFFVSEYGTLYSSNKSVLIRFQNNSNILKFDDLNSIEISPHAFFGAKMIHLGLQKVIKIGNEAFKESEIESIRISSPIEVGDESFMNSKSNFYIDSFTKIGKFAFAGTQLQKIEIDSLPIEIGIGAFKGCKQLEHAILPNNMSILSKSIFEGCEKLTTIISKNIVSVDDYAFSGCISLKSFPSIDCLKYIGKESFARTNINALIFRQRMTIKGGAFKESGLIWIFALNGIRLLESDAFIGSQKLLIHFLCNSNI